MSSVSSRLRIFHLDVIQPILSTTTILLPALIIKGGIVKDLARTGAIVSKDL